MPAVQRNGRQLASPPYPTKKVAAEPPIRSISSVLTPYLLLVYPVLLSIGSLYSVISPSAQSSLPGPPLTPGVTSSITTPEIPNTVNYFAGKGNLVNQYFVKIGWFWTSLAYVLLQSTARPSTTQHYIKSAIRYGILTFSWFLTTQWFFGPAIIDRSFAFTGGHCEPKAAVADPKRMLDISMELAKISSGLACKAAGGRWKGGHDISGHVFMLALSSAFLLYELWISDFHSHHPTIPPRVAATLAHDMSEEEKTAVGGWESETIARLRIWVRYFVYAVVGLDLWMFMMTAIWFHTWLEKLSGLMIAGVTLWSVYFLGQFVPPWQAIVG